VPEREALQEHDRGEGACESARGRGADDPAADDDDVVVPDHDGILRAAGQAGARSRAALDAARDNAW
jgi:hypothetical protein